VLKKYHGLGIGKKLLERSIHRAIQLEFDKVWVDVMSENVKTADWYYRQGFIKHETTFFKMGNSKTEVVTMYKLI
jgi:ribosomal protein S18 acetylase RimI-like enzyme